MTLVLMAFAILVGTVGVRVVFGGFDGGHPVLGLVVGLPLMGLAMLAAAVA